MTAVTTNPLRKYFREPGLMIRLPSGGNFCQPGALELGLTGELEVYPMTAYDELLLKNPDGLLSGDAIVKIIRSCAPGVHAPADLSVADVNAIMLAIRGASFGDELAVEVTCPACKHENSFGVSIRYLLETCTEMEPEYRVDLSDGVSVLMQPHSYAVATRASITTFEQIKTIQALKDQDLDDTDKDRMFEQAFSRLCRSNLTLLAEAVSCVIVPEGMVTDRQHIQEFVANIDARKADRLQAMLDHINLNGVRKTHEAVCQKCEHAWEARMSYDPSHFFG